MKKLFFMLLLLFCLVLNACDSDETNSNTLTSITDTDEPHTLTSEKYKEIFDTFTNSSRFPIAAVDFTETRIINQTTTTHKFKGISNFSSTTNAGDIKVEREGLGLVNDSNISNNEPQIFHFFRSNNYYYYYNAQSKQYEKYPLTFNNSRFTFLIQEPIIFAYYTAHGKEAYLKNTIVNEDKQRIKLTTTLTSIPDLIIMIEKFLGNVYNQAEKSTFVQYINQDKKLEGTMTLELDKETNAMLHANLNFKLFGKSIENIPMSSAIELEYKVTQNNSSNAIIIDESIINKAIDMTKQ